MKGKAIIKDDAVRCSICEEEIWEGTVCNCGLEEWEGIDEAYARLQEVEARKQTREEKELKFTNQRGEV